MITKLKLDGFCTHNKEQFLVGLSFTQKKSVTNFDRYNYNCTQYLTYINKTLYLTFHT